MSTHLMPVWPDTQPRYIAYCVQNGATSRTEMVERDRAAFPGGCMYPFISYISSSLAAYRKQCGVPAGSPFYDSDGFTDFLAERALAMRQPVRSYMRCCCCGASTRGRQWHNRDTGYGLCVDCITFCHRNESPAEFTRLYGHRGIHFDLPA